MHPPATKCYHLLSCSIFNLHLRAICSHPQANRWSRSIWNKPLLTVCQVACIPGVVPSICRHLWAGVDFKVSQTCGQRAENNQPNSLSRTLPHIMQLTIKAEQYFVHTQLGELVMHALLQLIAILITLMSIG